MSLRASFLSSFVWRNEHESPTWCRKCLRDLHSSWNGCQLPRGLHSLISAIDSADHPTMMQSASSICQHYFYSAALILLLYIFSMDPYNHWTSNINCQLVVYILLGPSNLNRRFFFGKQSKNQGISGRKWYRISVQRSKKVDTAH